MSRVPKVAIFDPSTGSSNLGDQIILEAILHEVRQILPSAFVMLISLHQPLSARQRNQISEADYVFVAGSNMLKGNAPFLKRWRRWQIGIEDLLPKKIILFGPGWSNACYEPTILGRYLYSSVLSGVFSHAVRDSLTRNRLIQMGISNVVNTSCPTLWSLSKKDDPGLPLSKGDDAVVTLTDYSKSPEKDKEILMMLASAYRRVFFWPQGADDVNYFRTLGVNNIKVLSPSINHYNELLIQNKSLDYVGTRLHGGIRALQYGHRAFVLAVDSRAREIQKDTDLPVFERDNLDDLEYRIHREEPINIVLDYETIEQWREQFR